MADEATTDMLMKFHAKSGVVPAECPLSISPNDELALRTELATGFTPGFYFLVSEFSFGAEVDGSEKRDGEDAAGTGRGAGRGAGSGGGGGGGPRLGGSLGGTGFTGASFGGGAGGTRGGSLGRGGDHFDDFSPLMGAASGGGSGGGSSGGGKGAQGGGDADARKNGAKKAGQFARWRSTNPTDKTWTSDGAYPAYIHEFSFTRLIDMASPVLFDFCCRKEAFPFVTFVKRKAAVAGSSAQPESLAYLRIDLADVLLTNIHWSDGDIVQESCQIICQKMRIIYWQQNADSTLVPIGSVDWVLPLTPPSSSS